MESIGVIGAGVIGRGVAQSFAMYDYKVKLIDINQEKLDTVKKDISNNIRFMKLYQKVSINKSVDEILANIGVGTSYEALKDCSFIVENIDENFDKKKDVYTKLNSACKKDCIYLVNTSCIPIHSIAELMTYPECVIGVHFMNPVPIKDTVEVIQSKYTSGKTLDTVVGLLKNIQKDGIVVNDFPGFVSNRVSHVFMNEAAYIVYDKIASVESVDLIFKKCFGHTMGPLETADLIGIDTVVNSLLVLKDNFGGSKFDCCPLLLEMVRDGKLGRKTGEGFYQYF